MLELEADSDDPFGKPRPPKVAGTYAYDGAPMKAKKRKAAKKG